VGKYAIHGCYRWRQAAQGSRHLVAPGDAGMLSVVEMSGHVTFDHSFLRKGLDHSHAFRKKSPEDDKDPLVGEGVSESCGDNEV